MAKYKKMSDEDILQVIDRGIADAGKETDNVLAKERQLVLDYYNGKKPAPQHAGNSKYISMDCFDTVESAKANLLETFAAGYDIAGFEPNGPDDVVGAKVASKYTDYVIFRENDGYKVFHDAIHDSLMSRVGVAKVYWDKQYYDSEEDFEDVDFPSLSKLLSQEDIDIKEQPTQDPVTGLFSGTIIRKENLSQVRIDPLPLEEFLISSAARDASFKTFKAHRMKKTVSDLLKMGMKQSDIDEIPSDAELSNTTEQQARLGDLSVGLKGNNELQDQLREVTVYECYLELDIDGNGETSCYKITKAGDFLIDEPEKILEDPFLPYVALPIPHQFWGNNFASKVIPIQNARSILVRGILDHTNITNNPRTLVVKGSLVNPKEMTDNRLGGVVNVTRPDGVFPYPQASLNPFVFQTIQLLDEDKEDTTGISKLSQGLNKDAVSKQNAAGMVENLVTLSQIRQKIMARNFAFNFLVPLYLKVYRLVLENEDRKKIFEVAGQFVEVTPSEWVERKKVIVALHLGYGEQDKEAAKYLGIHQMLSQDPAFKDMYGPEEKYNNVSKFLEHKGEKDISSILKNPKTIPPPQPDPMLVLAMEEKKTAIESNKAATALAEKKFTHEVELDALAANLERAIKMMDHMNEQREAERKEFEAKSRDEIAHRELAILESQEPTEVKQANIVSPNS